MQKSLKNYAKNTDDFSRLGGEKSQQIRELKALVIGLEVEL